MYIEDMSSDVYAVELHTSVRACSIGWLEDTIPTTGVVSPNLLAALEHFNSFHFVDEGELGYHECGLCREMAVQSRGEFWIERDGIRYVLPRLVIHYIGDHGYRPPLEFSSVVEKFWLSDDCRKCRDGSCERERENWDGMERFRKSP